MADQRGRYELHNFILNALEGALFAASNAFISPQTVLPALVARLGGSNVDVGTLGVIVYVGSFFPQIFAARHVQSFPWKKPLVVMLGTIQRFAVLMIGLNIVLFGSTFPSLALPMFFLFYSINQLLIGISTPGWFDLFAKLTPPKKRGRLFGIRSSTGGVGAFLCGLVLTILLASFQFPLNYAFAFFCAFLLQITSVIVQTRLVEEEPSQTLALRPMFEFLKDLPRVLKTNGPYRDFIIASAFLVVGSMPTGFFTVYALKHFQADESVVGQFTLSMVAVQVVSALAIGFVADRFGNKVGLLCAAVAMLLSSVSALIAPTVGWFCVVYLFLGTNLGTEVMARYNLSVEYGPVEHRSTYVGLTNTLLAPFFLSGILGGIISDLWGYPVMFACGIGFSLVGISLLTFRVRDPRLSTVQSGDLPAGVR